jgi:hypothetical protein
MGHACVQSDNDMGLCQGVCYLSYGQKWRNEAVDLLGNGVRQALFVSATPHDRNLPAACFELLAHRDPIRFRPEFFGATGARNERCEGGGPCGRPGYWIGLQAKVWGRARQLVSKELCAQASAAIYGVELAWYAGSMTVKQ